MIAEHFTHLVESNFGLPLSPDQQNALYEFVNFFFDSNGESIFVLRGFAGTGKTSLVAAVVSTIKQLNREVVLMAPTGRAAKQFSSYAHLPAYTIHKQIYRQKVGGVDSEFDLGFNKTKYTLYFVDEASMISNEKIETTFGSGRLLDDLVHFVYNGRGNRIVFIGDEAQLPPIGVTMSPALDCDELSILFSFEIYHARLTSIMRQSEASGILINATIVRDCLGTDISPIFKTLFKDVHRINGGELLEELERCYSTYGIEETMIICRSNNRANRYNQGVRARVLYCEEEINGGDRIMIVKNNYFWGKDRDEIDFIANGEIATLKKVGRNSHFYNHNFAKCDIYIDDIDQELEVELLLDTLMSESPALTYNEQLTFFRAVEEDYMDIKIKKKRYDAMRENRYYNALQIKFAYAITGHKSQGGQWDAIFVDQGWLPEEQRNDDYWRWLYTAMTRSKKELFWVNFDESFFQE